MPPVGRFGHYEILESLGAGGMGDVYRARDSILGRLVAIKVIRPTAATDPARLARFEHEARAASALSHPNIVTIYEIGSVQSVRYIAMELVEGRTLREILQQGPLVTRRALQLSAQAADGLANAHEAGIIHRDLKPENIMVTRDGRVKLLDFGLAKLVPPLPSDEASTGSFGSNDTPGTQPGTVLGTVAYMSPEQAMGSALDFRSDHFSCGAILYEMATGRPPFRRSSAVQTLAAIIEDEPEPIAELNPSVPPPLRWIIERCLAKSPVDRYGSTRDLARDLANVLDHLAEVSSGSGPSVASVRRIPRLDARRAVIGVIATVALSAAAATWLAPRFGSSGPPASMAAKGAAKARRSVAVLGFKNLSRREDAAWLSAALAEMLTTELAVGGGLRTIPGENVGRMKMELSLSDAESLARDSLTRVGRNLGADLVLLGSYVTLPGDLIRLDLRLQDVAAGETIAALAENGTEAGIVDLVTRAGSRLRQSVGIGDPPAAEASTLEAGAPSNLDAQRLYGEGVARLRVLDALAAKDLLQKAVSADPGSPMIHVALADAWATLGHDPRAKEEAQRAFDLSSRLTREERLAVEGRFRELAGEWERAIEIYGALLAFFPDNVEYGLQLAVAQGTAGRGSDALVTLDRLRKLASPASDDPRIDLTESVVAQSVGDFKRQQAAAGAAAAKGAAQGARLVVAKARLREAYALDRLGSVAKAAVAADEARRIYVAAGDQGGLAAALNAVGSLSWNHGELEKARSTWEESLAIRRKIGYRSGVAISLHNLGLVAWEQGELSAARRYLEESLAVDRELGSRSDVAADLRELAGLFQDMGDLPRAVKTIDEAIALNREVGDRTEAALSQLRLALLMQAQGDLARAEVGYRQVLPILKERGTRDYVADTLFALGDLLTLRGDLALAGRSHDEAMAVRSEMEASFAVAKSRTALAGLAMEGGSLGAAVSLLQQATAVFAAQKAADWEASTQALLARCLLADGRAIEAQRALEKATALSGRSQSPKVRLSVAVSAASVHGAGGRIADARRELDAALAEARRLGLVGAQLEIRLARCDVDGSSARDAVAGLTELLQDARSRGFGLVARKAEERLGRRTKARDTNS